MTIRLLFAVLMSALIYVFALPSAIAQNLEAFEDESESFEAVSPSKPQPPTDVPCAAAPSFPIREICRITNVERKKRSLAPLQWDSRLARVAQAHARDMHVRNYFSHTTPEGRTVKDRLDRGRVPYMWSGENIAWGYETPEKFMAAWMKSRGHRENILLSKYTRIGIGWAGSKVVQNFTDGRSREGAIEAP